MKTIEDLINEEFTDLDLFENMDTLMTLLEKYEGVAVLMDTFSKKLKINEKTFSVKFNKVLGKLISHFNNQNALINQLPRQFVFNEIHKKEFIDILPMTEKEIYDTIKEWVDESAARMNFSGINDRTIREIFLPTFPYAYLAMTVKDEELALNMLLMINLLMYAINYPIFFPKYNYLEDKAEYVIQHVLRNKGFAKYESVYDLMRKLSIDTLQTFSNREFTDRELYVMVYNNIQDKIKYHLKQFYGAYTSVGNVYLSTTKDVMVTSDRDGKSSTVESNIQNDSAIITSLVRRVVSYVSDPDYIEEAPYRRVMTEIMGINPKVTITNIDKKTLVERNFTSMVVDIQRGRDFEVVISNILQNFLWSDDKSKLNVKHIETPYFLKKVLYDISYIKNNRFIKNIIDIADVSIDRVLEERGKSVKTIDNKTLQRYRKSIILYFSIITQNIIKRG